MIRFRHLLALSVLAGSSTLLSAQQSISQRLQEDYQIAIKKTNEKIELDGNLRENTWKEADVATGFWMSFPIDGERVDPEDQTEVRLAYDDNFIYVSAVCYDDNNHVIQTLKRDDPTFWQGDAFSIVIDPVNERTNAFSFAVNPANVQSESLVSGQTGRRGDQRPGRPPQGINSAWDNKWFSIVKSHGDRWIVEMAIPFKTLRFKPDKTVWGVNFIRGEPQTNSYHTWSPVPVQFRGVDLGYTGTIRWDAPPPDVKSNISLIPYALGSVVKDFEDESPSDISFQSGIDAKVAITPSLNLDVTLNPDFSQVEVDAQVTNLTTFSIRFPERRLFFLENSDIFSEFGIPPMRPFFSRRIGLDSDGNSIPILYGARLSGNLNKDLRIGLMNMHTKETDIFAAQNYTSLAMHQRVLKRSTIRGYFHNRQAMQEGEFQGNDFNRIAGAEFNYRSLDGKWRALAGYGLSFTENRKNKNEFYNFAVGYDTRNVSFYSNLAGIGDNYYADMGWIPSADHYDAVRDTMIHVGFLHNFTRFSYTIFPKNSPKVISHVLGARNVTDVANTGKFIKNDLSVQYNLNWKNTSAFGIEVTNADFQLLFPFAFTDGEPLPVGKYHFNYLELTYKTDQRKILQLEGGLQVGEFYNGNLTQYNIGARYRTRPWGNFGVNFTLSNLDFPSPYGSEDLFLISPRIEINFSETIYWTTFLQYNTQRDNFNINSRFQWRFQPMSDLFIVYSDNYAVEFWGPKNRALVIKLNYWLNL